MARTKGSTNKTGAKGKRGGGRRSKAESMTEAKANEVEVRGPGDNSGELDLQPVVIEERDFNLHYKAIKAATDKMETAKNLVRTAKKHAKEASPDILDAVNAAMKFERMDHVSLARELQIAGYALKATDNPIQLTLHNTLLGDAVEQAGKRGYREGTEGKSCDSPYPAGSELDSAYREKWTVGQAEKLGFSPEDAAKMAAELKNDGEENWPDDTDIAEQKVLQTAPSDEPEIPEHLRRVPEAAE